MSIKKHSQFFLFLLYVITIQKYCSFANTLNTIKISPISINKNKNKINNKKKKKNLNLNLNKKNIARNLKYNGK